MAAEIRPEPFRLQQSATYLEQWLTGLLPQEPALDVSYVLRKDRVVQPASCSTDIPVMDLEPQVHTVVVGKGKRKQAATDIASPPSAWAKFVYPMATHLLDHGTPGTML